MGQIRIAEAMRDHLPAVAALYEQGRLSSRVVAAITWRTRLITDDAVWSVIDAAIVERAEKWGPLAEDKRDDAVDALVQRHDPAAVVASQSVARTHDFTVGSYGDEDAGVTSVWGKLLTSDAALLDKRVSAMAAQVCENHPRSMGERLSCACGLSSCPVRGDRPPSRSSVVVRVLADPAAVDASRGVGW